MKRREFIYSSAGVTSTVALAGCIDPEDEPNDNSTNTPNNDENNDPNDEENNNDENMQPTGITNGSFENGLEDWTVGKDLPDVPGGSEPVDSEVSVSSERASEGSQSVSMYIEGIADDGTVWVEQTVDLTDYDTFKVDAYSQMRSFNILSELAFFAGDKPSDGLTEVDFNRDNDIEDHEGWKSYEYDVSDLEGEKTVAFGMNVIWETGVTRLLDNARLE